MPPSKHSQAGGILIYILIGIVLFGMLIYAYSRSGNTSASISTKANTKVEAQSFIDYNEQIANAVNKLMANGIGENQISFENTFMKNFSGTVVSDPSKYSNCTSNKCRVFSPGIGGVVPRRASSVTVDPSLYPNYYMQPGMGWPHQMIFPDVGTTATDLTFTLFLLSKDTCIQINNLLGHNFSPNPPLDDGDGAPEDWSQTFSSSVYTLGAWAKGKTAFCYQLQSLSPPLYVYERVVIAR